MIQRLVVDTDVISFLFKGDTRAKLYEPHLNGRQLIVSFMTVAELYRWAEHKNWALKRISQLDEHLRKFVISPVDPNLCKKWAHITSEGDKKGKPIQCADAWIAATALSFGIPLVTHNTKDFANVDQLTVISVPESKI